MGTITLGYSGIPNGVQTDVSASADISDDNGQTLLAWIQDQLSNKGYGDTSTSDTAFNALLTRFVINLEEEVLQWQQAQAIAVAVSQNNSSFCSNKSVTAAFTSNTGSSTMNRKKKLQKDSRDMGGTQLPLIAMPPGSQAYQLTPNQTDDDTQ